MAEGGFDEVADGLFAVGEGGDDDGVLAAGFSEDGAVGRPLAEEDAVA